jgi:predicted DNA-binding protein
MPKEKVLSVRLRDDQIKNLDELSKTMDTTKSKFVRRLVNQHLKANESGKKVYNVKIQPAQYKTLEELAQKTNMKPEKYLRKLIKSNMGLAKNGKSPSEAGINKDEYNGLEKDFKELYKRYEDLTLNYNQVLDEKTRLESRLGEMESTIEVLSKLKDEFLNQLLFLMKFFQKNGKLLQEHDKKYILEKKEQFAIIAKQLEGMA